MNILVTGGAGYVGSILTKELLGKGHRVTVVDNLGQGHRDAVLPEAELVVADIRDAGAVKAVLLRARVDAVMHLAAETIVERSLADPSGHFQVNVVGGLGLLDGMLECGVRRIVFSSSAAVYGEPTSALITEDCTQNPLNAYGESKLMFERILQWYGRAYGLKHIALRYFNAAGAGEELGEDHSPETHLIPNVLVAALNGDRPVSVFGVDYPTRDGSCVRDYNLGSGSGSSVLEVLTAVKRVTGMEIPMKVCQRRPGDPATLVASSDRARTELGWTPQRSGLDTIVESAWRWLRAHPHGYEE